MNQISIVPLDKITIYLDSDQLQAIASEIKYFITNEDGIDLILLNDLCGQIIQKIRHRAEVPRKSNQFSLTTSQAIAMLKLISENDAHDDFAVIAFREMAEMIQKQLI